MIDSISLWHVTPTDIGVEFLDPTDTALATDEWFYHIANHPEVPIARQDFSKSDYKSIKNIRRFLKNVREEIKNTGITIADEFPQISGCFVHFLLSEQLHCFVLVNGTAVFFEKGNPFDIPDEKYFGIPAFYERQIYEDDYCKNKQTSPRKKPVYDFLALLWRCVGSKQFHFSASEKYGNRGIAYTLCMTMIDVPGLVSNRVDEQMKKNIRALLDTSAFNNIYNEGQWNVIRERIDTDDISDLNLKELSENLVFADNWSGVVVAGDLKKNLTCLTWLMTFEIFLQSNWLLFDAYSENVARQDMSAIELQGVLNRVEYVKVMIDNDISSNMEPSRHVMNNSLIDSSDINTVYSKMHGMVSNKLKMKIMSDDRKKSRFSLLSDVSLLIIAILQIYGVVAELLKTESLSKTDFLTMGIMLFITVVCVWIMVKGKK